MAISNEEFLQISQEHKRVTITDLETSVVYRFRLWRTVGYDGPIEITDDPVVTGPEQGRQIPSGHILREQPETLRFTIELNSLVAVDVEGAAISRNIGAGGQLFYLRRQLKGKHVRVAAPFGLLIDSAIVQNVSFEGDGTYGDRRGMATVEIRTLVRADQAGLGVGTVLNFLKRPPIPDVTDNGLTIQSGLGNALPSGPKACVRVDPRTRNARHGIVEDILLRPPSIGDFLGNVSQGISYINTMLGGGAKDKSFLEMSVGLVGPGIASVASKTAAIAARQLGIPVTVDDGRTYIPLEEAMTEGVSIMPEDLVRCHAAGGLPPL